MSEQAAEIIGKIVELARTLPATPSDYASLSPRKRRALREDLDHALQRLSAEAQTLDSIRQPKHVLDPTSPREIGKMVAHALLLQARESLATVARDPFYGAGVYALYYRGPFPCYAPVSGRNHPVYVGKADPAIMHALSPESQGTRLHTRLKDHHRSISSAKNLDIAHFDCRYLVVRSAWVETAESLLIDWYQPIWNNEVKVCYGFGKHGDSASTRKNERSPWDTLHPGRVWATSAGNQPNKRTISQIQAAIAEHFKRHPPKD